MDSATGRAQSKGKKNKKKVSTTHDFAAAARSAAAATGFEPATTYKLAVLC